MNKFTRIIRSASKPKRTQKETSVGALDLEADLVRLDIIIKLIEPIDEMNIGDSNTQQQRDFNRDMKRSTVALVRTWERYATLLMRRKYLTP